MEIRLIHVYPDINEVNERAMTHVGFAQVKKIAELI